MTRILKPCALGLILLTLVGLACPDRAAGAESQQLQRLAFGDFRLHYTTHSPQYILYRGKPLVKRIYFYTAVKSESGKMIEGFNFRRDEDGFLHFEKATTDDGVRLTWRNQRFVRAAPNRPAGKLAGEATVTLTLTKGQIHLRHQGRIEPNPGFGEIGFFIPEEALTGGTTSSFTASRPNGQTMNAEFPLPERKEWNIFNGLTRLAVDSAETDYELSIDGWEFAGSHGQHFQDFRKGDSAPGCYRFVLSFDTSKGNTFDYAWRLSVRPGEAAVKASAAATDAGGTAVPLSGLAKTPELRPVTMGDATSLAPNADEGTARVAALRLDTTDSGQLSLSDGDQPIVLNDYFMLFQSGTPTREDTTDGDIRRVVLKYDTAQGSLVKQAVISPGEAWLSWTVQAKRDLKRNEVGFYCAASAFRAPFITYRSVNQSMVGERDEVELSSSYCIVAGGEEDTREFQCGTSGRPDWMLQDFRERGERYRFVATPGPKAGDEWRAVFRYVHNGAEPYPAVSFDQAREERGILSTLLPDAIEDGFTIVPVRSAKYTFTGQPLSVKMKYYSTDHQDRTVRLSCRVQDTWGRDAGAREYELSNGGRRFAMIEFPVTAAANGAYRMDIAYQCGGVSRTRELIFTVMPEIPDTGYRPGSVYGAALGSGDYLGMLAKRIGLKWNRCHCAIGDTQCGLVQPERGTYTWDGIERACEFHRKYQFLGCHSISEGWKAEWLRTLWKEGSFEAYLDAYVEEYVRPLAERFKGKINWWEVTNEPYYQFRDSPEKWVALMKRTYETLKAIDPDCTVVGTCGPPGSMGYSWYRRTFALGSLNYQDAVSSHLYHFGPWVGSGIACGVRKWMREIRKIMAEHGKVVPLINSETTVTPPSSMYRHPSHTRYVRYHPGESPTDPVEQAQAYFKVLVMHEAEDVKYSFHIFHGGVEYTSHTGEYDETPLAFLAAQATLAKVLEEAEYLEDIPLDDQVQVCLFKQADQLILIPWGPMFLKQDYASVSLPLPASRFRARDVFDNPLSVNGDDRTTQFAVTWEGFFLLTDSVSVDELKSAWSSARVALHFAQDPQLRIAGVFSGDGAGPANRASWVGFHPVDLTAACNRSFTDETPEDGQGGWTDEGQNDMRNLPTGEWLINGVPFRILDPSANDGTSCIVLKGGMNPNATFPESVSVPIGKRLSKLHFLHTVTWGNRTGPGFRYVLHYRDGYTEEVPVEMRKNVADWWWQGDVPEAQVAWEGPNSVRDKVRLYHVTHEVGHPKGAQAVLERVEIISACKRPIPVVVALTGVYSN